MSELGGCILHFGMPKTGSSSIQTWLLQEMDDERFHYLHLGRRGSGNIMVSAFLEDPQRHHRNVKRGVSGVALSQEVESIRSQFQHQLTVLGGQTAIFSAELLTSIKATELRAIVDLMARYCGEVRAVGYVRPPVSFMESVFQERIKAGSSELRLRRLYPNYRRHLEKFEALLGRSQVDFWPFAPREFSLGCVVHDFCERTGVQCGDEAVPRVNDGLSLPAIRLLYAYRRCGPGYGVGEAAMRQNRELAHRLSQLKGPKLRLHRDVVAPLLHEFADDLAWMEERAGIKLGEAISGGDDAVRDEADLLRFDAEALEWLGEQIERPALKTDASGGQVAAEVQLLRERLATRTRGPSRPSARLPRA